METMNVQHRKETDSIKQTKTKVIAENVPSMEK